MMREGKKAIAAGAVCYVALALVGGDAVEAGTVKKYSADAYVAGMGGHFAAANISLDASDPDAPIRIKSLRRIDIGSPLTHKFHDPRIDVRDRKVIFWSTYQKDPLGKMHVGKSELTTGKVIKDMALDPDTRAPGDKGPLYCSSGQSRTNFMPIFMGVEGYVDVIDKDTLAHKHRIFVRDLGYDPQEQLFVHGVNSNDMRRFVLSVTLKGADGKASGRNDIVLIDLEALSRGKLKELKRVTLSGEPGKTITFRQYFSKDDKHIFQAAGDRLYVLDAKTLKVLDERKTPGENHDAMPTPDGKYALLTVRIDGQAKDANGKVIEKDGKPVPIKDGAVVAYDFGAKKIIGKPESVCNACHRSSGLGDRNAIACGLDANYRI